MNHRATATIVPTDTLRALVKYASLLPARFVTDSEGVELLDAIDDAVEILSDRGVRRAA